LFLRNPNIGQGQLEWEPISSSEIDSGILNWMYVRNREEEILASPLEKRMKFWDEMFKTNNMPKEKNEQKVEL